MRAWKISLLTAGASMAMACGSASALDTSSASAESEPSRFDVAFGVGAATDYVARGISQTNSHPAIQGFVEANFERFYAGLFASNVSLGTASDAELDLSVGWRPSAHDFDFDFGYVQYVYVNNFMGSNFGEFYAGVTRSVLKDLTLGSKVSYAPNYAGSGTSAVYVEGVADYALPHNFGISGAVGYQFFDAAYAPSYLNGNIGVYWNVTPQVKLDLRLSSTNLTRTACAALMSVGNECDTRVLFSMSFSELVSNLVK